MGLVCLSLIHIWSLPGHRDPSATAKLQEPFIPERPKGTQHRIGVDAENGSQVPGRRKALAWTYLALGDGPPHEALSLIHIYHVDLDVGYLASDWPTQFVEGELAKRLRTLPGRADHADLLAWLLDRARAPDLAPW